MLLRDGRHDGLAAILGGRLRRMPEDAVALFYAGALTTTRPAPEAKAAGMRLIRSAIDRGIDRFMPLDPWLRDLAATHAPADRPLESFEAEWPAARSKGAMRP